MGIDVELGKESLEGLKFLAKTHRDLHNGRVAGEVKLVITCLTFYVACVVIIYTGDVASSAVSPFTIGTCCALLVSGIAAFLYLYGSGQANRVSQNVAERAEDVIAKALNEACKSNRSKDEICALLQKITFKPPPRILGFHPNRLRWLWQAVVVICGAFIAALMILAKPT